MELQLTELKEQVRTLFEKDKECRKEAEELRRRVDALESETSNIHQTLVSIKYIEESISEIKKTLKEITDVPANRYNQVVAVIITGVVGAIIGYFI